MTRPALAVSSIRRSQLLALAISGASGPAMAQLEKVGTTLTTIQTTLVGIGVTCLTIAIIWAGFKYIFQHARWSDISNILVGGIMIGAATAIATWLAGAA